MSILKKISGFPGRLRAFLFRSFNRKIFKVAMGQTYDEIRNMKRLVLETKNTEGDLVEIGVLLGGSAEIILSAKEKGKNLYLIDSFAGIREANSNDPVEWHNDSQAWKDGKVFDNSKDNDTLKNAFEFVTNRFKDDNSVKIIKGYFPPKNLPEGFENKKFSFVHMDVDAYEGTKACVEYFYPKMAPGGIMLFHDYIHEIAPVKKICDDFFSDKPEKIKELGTSQAYIKKEGGL